MSFAGQVVRIVALVAVLVGAAWRPARADGPARPIPRVVREQAELRPGRDLVRPRGVARDTPAVPPPALALPIEIERGWLLIRAEAGMDAVAARAADRLPVSFAAIADDLRDLPVPRRVELRLVHRTEDLARVAPPGRGAPAWANGVAWPDLGVMAVAARRGAELIELDSTIDHELAHLALGAALGGRAPRWLDEGFAYLHSSEWSMSRAATLTGMAWTGDVIPFDQLDQHFRGAEDRASRAYTQAYDLVAFLALRGRHADADDDGDRWPFRDFLGLVAAGTSLDQAARQAYAAPIRDLYREWYDGLRRRYLMVPIELFGVTLWVLAAGFLVLAFIRRRRQHRAALARWDEEERARPAVAADGPVEVASPP